jgi:hypothetical protein
MASNPWRTQSSQNSEVMTEPVLLNDHQLQAFLREGYISVEADLSAGFHSDVHSQITHLYATSGNPGNDILPLVPDLHRVLAHAAVAGALTSLLGPDYLLHPHRHCHQNLVGSQGQGMHEDSYEADQNVRHHRLRWVMAFYYPQHVNADNGPSSIVPGTQYMTTTTQHAGPDELPLQGRAGTVTFVHYDLWHRAMANSSDHDRFMVKFLFTRMSEPLQASWKHEGAAWPSTGRSEDALLAGLWDWMRGVPTSASDGSPSVAQLTEQLEDEDEMRRYAAACHLGVNGREGVVVLLEALRREGGRRLQGNIDRSHTNPVQFDAAYGLTAAGPTAVPVLINLLRDASWWLRASAADILGDIGLAAVTGVDALIESLQDESEWVRRNAAEALGNMGEPAAAAQPDLAECLQDCDTTVRYNAALALAKIKGGNREALHQATEDENPYVRDLAIEAITRSMSSMLPT